MTRYLMTLRTYDSVATIAPEAAADGAWVYADEADAEIRELEAERDDLKHRIRSWVGVARKQLRRALVAERERDDLRRENARMREALEMVLKWVEVRHLDNDHMMEEWYLAVRAAVEGWPQVSQDADDSIKVRPDCDKPKETRMPHGRDTRSPRRDRGG